ncbi:MAG TPA: hypothetical protein VGM37_01180 [Armatimonadota bacterium]|jgi:hypothetical protein
MSDMWNQLDWPRRLFLLAAPLCWTLIIPGIVDAVRFGRRIRRSDPAAPRAAVRRLAWYRFACSAGPAAGAGAMCVCSAVGGRLPAWANTALYCSVVALPALPFIVQRLLRIEVTRAKVASLQGRGWQAGGIILYWMLLALLGPFSAIAFLLAKNGSALGAAMLAGVAALAVLALRGIWRLTAVSRS